MSDLEDRAGLGERVRRRRERLGLTIDEAAERGPVSPVTWSRVENGGKVRRLSYGAVDRVLDWPEGACVDFLQHGTEPLVARSGQGVDSKAEWDEIARLIAEYRRLVAEIIDRVPDRKRAQVGAAADLTVSLMEESTSTDRSK